MGSSLTAGFGPEERNMMYNRYKAANPNIAKLIKSYLFSKFLPVHSGSGGIHTASLVHVICSDVTFFVSLKALP